MYVYTYATCSMYVSMYIHIKICFDARLTWPNYWLQIIHSFVCRSGVSRNMRLNSRQSPIFLFLSSLSDAKTWPTASGYLASALLS